MRRIDAFSGPHFLNHLGEMVLVFILGRYDRIQLSNHRNFSAMCHQSARVVVEKL
jgi:hypothetical protein